MPKCWADRLIMFSVIALVAWAIIGLPALKTFVPTYQPAYAQTSQPTANSAKAEEPWLTKDAGGFFTFLLVVVGSFQVGLFVWQLRLIRDSLDDAKNLAIAAKESADTAKIQAEVAQATLTTMQDTAARQLRAYVSVNNAAFKFLPSTNRTYIDVVIRNYGQTPAYGMIVTVEAAVALIYSADAVIPISTEAEAQAETTFAPGHSNTIHINRNEMAQMFWERHRNARCHGYIWGRIDYKDAFDKAHFTTFQLVNDFTDTESFSFCQKGNISN
jgi:hypothetical protein